MNNFNDYQLSKELLKSIHMLNYKRPTKVQEQVIPVMLKKNDMIVKSQTGSGKTAAFAIPICELVVWDENKVQALVIVPTRELAIQVKEDIFNLGRFKRLKVSALYGRDSFTNQELELKQKTHVIVGTPGRIIDHLERGTLDLSEIKFLIIDEADEMFKMGFIEQIASIFPALPKERGTVVLSATMPKDIEILCHQYMKEPITVEVEESNPTIERISQERIPVLENDKITLLQDLLIVENPDSCIIFCNTKQMVDEVYHELRKWNAPIEKIHGGMEQRDRIKGLNRFRKGDFRYLIATDVAARGIDIDDISLVINYEIPKNVESYVHRIGRTGRMDHNGRAITFVQENEMKLIEDIQTYIAKDIPLKNPPTKDVVFNCKEEFERKIYRQADPKKAKDELIKREVVTLHINAGKKTKMRTGDIVGALCNINGMTSEDIGAINIKELSTFVDILNNKGKLVVQELQSTPIKGKVRKVRLSYNH